MTTDRARAFAAIRKVIGVELCGKVEALDPDVRQTTHNLRSALAGLLVMHTRSITRECPNCGHWGDNHNAKCVLNLLFKEMG